MIPTDWTAVASTNVSAIKWANGVLSVQYKHGGVYEFEGVSAADAEMVLHAASVGQALRAVTGGAKGKRAG